MQEFHRALAQVERDEAEVAADAVLAVNNGISRFHFRQIAHHAFGGAARASVAPARLPHLPGIELGFGDEGDRLGLEEETLCDRSVGERDRMARGEKSIPVVDERRMQTVLGEELRQRLAPSRSLGDDERAAAEAVDEP